MNFLPVVASDFVTALCNTNSDELRPRIVLLTLLLLDLGAKVAETRDTDFQLEVTLAVVRTLHSCKGDSLVHLFRLFQGAPEAREDLEVQPEPKDKTKSEEKHRLMISLQVASLQEAAWPSG